MYARTISFLVGSTNMLMYTKHISLLVGSIDIYGFIFYQVYLLPSSIKKILVMFNYGYVVFGCCITSTYLSGYAKVCHDWLNEDFME